MAWWKVLAAYLLKSDRVVDISPIPTPYPQNFLCAHHIPISFNPPRGSVCLTSVCLSRTLGLSWEQRGLGRPKLAQR